MLCTNHHICYRKVDSCIQLNDRWHSMVRIIAHATNKFHIVFIVIENSRICLIFTGQSLYAHQTGILHSSGQIMYMYLCWIIRGYHMGGSVIWFLSNEWWCDITNERGTSEWVISHQHEFDKIISQCHPCDYLFIIYHNTRTNRNFVHTYHSHIYYTSTYCHFLTLQIAVCLSCQTQQAIHNASVWRVVAKKKY